MNFELILKYYATECFPPTPSEPFLTAATNGTIKLSMTVPSVCVYGIVTPLPYDQVVVKCSAMNAGSSFQVSLAVFLLLYSLLVQS